MSTYSPNLRLELITTGDQAGTWGTTTNTNLGSLLEAAVTGYASVSVTSANQALTALNGAVDQSRNMTLALTTTTTAAFSVYAPPSPKLYIVYNASAYNATLYNSTVLGNTTAAGTGVTIPAGKTMGVWTDGTNFKAQVDHLPTLSLTVPLTLANGGTGGNSAASARTNLDVPSTTGSGASGTWSISVTGSAGSVGNSLTFNSSGAGAASPQTYNGSAAITVSYNTLGASPLAGSTSLTTTGTVTTGTWSASFGAVSGANLTNLTAGNLTGTIPSAVLGNSTVYVGTTAILLNRASAAQSLTGVTSIDGSAATLTTARTINGTSFNGSANITTASWGTARTITLGSTGKSVDGSANVSWTLTEMGAAPTAAPTFTGVVTLSSGSLVEKQNAVAASNIDLSLGNFFSKTITGTTTFTVSNTATSGQANSFILDLTNGGAFTINWWTGVKWAGGAAPTLTSSGRDVLGFFTYDGGTTWTGLVLGKDVK